ncbi:hypothetical protein PENTCL1PPCAC_15438, partial [Pristionchus entomophagus]
ARFPHHIPLHDLIAILIHFTLDGAGILGNAALVLAISAKSPTSWRSYKVLLLNGAITDCLSSFTSLLSIGRVIPAPFGKLIVHLGPCVLVSPGFCHLLYSIMMNFTTHSVHLIAISFIYRLHMLNQ